MDLRPKFSFLQVVLVLVSWTINSSFAAEFTDCGYYWNILISTETGSLMSPNYPSQYNSDSKCIWLLQALANYTVTLTIPSVAGQNSSTGDCVDYVQVREGSSTSNLLFQSCDQSTSITLTSSSRWMWVKFVSDSSINNKGFTATWSISKNPNTNASSIKSPVADCPSTRWSCRNKECVSWAWRCDGQNDCGCTGTGCDEEHCGGTGLGDEMQVVIGVSIGTFIFLLVFVGVGMIEIVQKRRQAQKDKEVMEQHNRAIKNNRKKPKVMDLVGYDLSASTTSSRFEAEKSKSFFDASNTSSELQKAMGTPQPPPPEKNLYPSLKTESGKGVTKTTAIKLTKEPNKQ